MFRIMQQNHVANPPQTIWRPELRPELPYVYGPLDYHLFRNLLVEIDRLFRTDIETRFAREALALLPADAGATARARCDKHAVLALRCNIARKLTGLDYCGFAVRAIESHLLHWFLGITSLDMVRAPSKSTLECLDKILPAQALEKFVCDRLGACTRVIAGW
jgi:hypothetical protein